MSKSTQNEKKGICYNLFHPFCNSNKTVAKLPKFNISGGLTKLKKCEISSKKSNSRNIEISWNPHSHPKPLIFIRSGGRRRAEQKIFVPDSVFGLRKFLKVLNAKRSYLYFMILKCKNYWKPILEQEDVWKEFKEEFENIERKKYIWQSYIFEVWILLGIHAGNRTAPFCIFTVEQWPC